TVAGPCAGVIRETSAISGVTGDQTRSPTSSSPRPAPRATRGLVRRLGTSRGGRRLRHVIESAGTAQCHGRTNQKQETSETYLHVDPRCNHHAAQIGLQVYEKATRSWAFILSFLRVRCVD